MNASSETGDHLGEIYNWIDGIKFSRPKKNIARDFSDGGNKHLNLVSAAISKYFNNLKKYFSSFSIGKERERISHRIEIYHVFQKSSIFHNKKNSILVLMAELLKLYYPKYVDVHNYITGNSVSKKIDNWCMLNRKVLSKIDMKLGKEVINQLASSQPGIIEKVLSDLRVKILKTNNIDRESLYLCHEECKGT